MIPNDELLAEIARLGDGDTPPTYTEFENRSQYSARTVENSFKSWNHAIEKAGFKRNYDISDKDLLTQLAKDVSGQIAPPAHQFEGRYGINTYRRHCGSWWKACVRARLLPAKRQPLTPDEFSRFFNAAITHQKAEYRVIALLTQFTGLTPEISSNLSKEWTTVRAGETIVTVPDKYTQSDKEWTFRIPATWTTAQGERRDTTLPRRLECFLNRHTSINRSHSMIRETIYRIAADADSGNREHRNHPRLGTVPIVQAENLRVSGGVQMARNGAPKRRIRRHLGINQTGWDADVEDFFLWLYVHENHVHNQYDPPDIVLDPV